MKKWIRTAPQKASICLLWDILSFQPPEEETLSQAPESEEEQKKKALERSM